MQLNSKGASWNVIPRVWGFCCKPVLPNTDLANRLANELIFQNPGFVFLSFISLTGTEVLF